MVSHTDLAVESYESKQTESIEGIEVTDSKNITKVVVKTEEAAQIIGKPIGNYVTLQVKSFVNDTDIFDGRLDDFSNVLDSMLPKSADSVLVAGLGNLSITADALGPKTNNYVLSTRHIADELEKVCDFKNVFPVSTINTGVLGETGIETAEIIKGVVSQVKPSLVIVVDALAASSADRLGTTVQFSDSGISPGSGVGNHRHEISESTLGVPVISIGIPTVVSTAIISGNNSDTAFVTPREIDRITEQGAKLIGMGINVCLQKSIDCRDLFALVG